MTFKVLRVAEIGYQPVEIEQNGQSISFLIEHQDPIDNQQIQMPLADWPEIRDFINKIYTDFVHLKNDTNG